LVDGEGWRLSAESIEKLDQEAQDRLAHLKSWLAKKDAPRETARPSDCRECCTETETFESSASIPCTTRTADA
jgi:hypothetical protein